MYDLNTRGRLEVRSYANFNLVRVLAEDVSIREAFPLAEVAGSHDGFIHFIVGGVAYPEHFGIHECSYLLQYDDENNRDMACFTGPESGWSPDLDAPNDVPWDSSVVWEDGALEEYSPIY